MRRILEVIAENLARGPATVRLPETVPAPPGYRGTVAFDPTRCLACGMCSYVCVSDAIVTANEATRFTWAYEPGRCTFCARCTDHCPGIALSMTDTPPPPYAHPGELAVQRDVVFPACTECGVPTRPVTDEFLKRAFGKAGESTLAAARRCPTCRRRRLQTRTMQAAIKAGKEKTP